MRRRATDGLDFFAIVRSEPEEIQLSQAHPASLPHWRPKRPLLIPWRVPQALKPPFRPSRNLPLRTCRTFRCLKSKKLAPPTAKTSLLRSTSWLAHLLPRLTPLYSLIYKNLALVILGALFTAFVAFGVMIVFFLTSNKWSAPITLSRGHELVIKVERELSDLNVRRNQISEQIDDAKKNLKSSQDELAAPARSPG